MDNNKSRIEKLKMELNKTYPMTMSNYSFHTLPREVLDKLFKDGRHISPFMEYLVAQEFGLTHIPGCKGYDMVDPRNPEIKYEQKMFTANGCKFMPSSMIGTKRTFDQTIFAEKAAKLIYVIVSNIAFPDVKIRFVTGIDMLARYPNGIIPYADHDMFFSI
jgi:hypothetical protein